MLVFSPTLHDPGKWLMIIPWSLFLNSHKLFLTGFACASERKRAYKGAERIWWHICPDETKSLLFSQWVSGRWITSSLLWEMWQEWTLNFKRRGSNCGFIYLSFSLMLQFSLGEKRLLSFCRHNHPGRRSFAVCPFPHNEAGSSRASLHLCLFVLCRYLLWQSILIFHFTRPLVKMAMSAVFEGLLPAILKYMTIYDI